MTLQEVVPAIGGPIWTRLNALFFEDVSHRLAADPADAELSQFSDDSGVPEAGRLRDFYHQLADFTRLPGTAFRVFHLWLVFVAHPAVERRRRDQLKTGDREATGKLWERYFRRLVGLNESETGIENRID